MNRIIGYILQALIILFLVSIPLAYIFDYNIRAIMTYPLYSLLDTLSGYFRYSALFPYLAEVPIVVLVIMTLVTIGIIKLLTNKEERLKIKIIFPLLGIALLAVVLKFAIPSMEEDYKLIYHTEESSIVIKSDEVERHRKMKGYRFTADIYEENMTLHFTSYQYYNIRKANEEQNGRNIRVYYLEKENLRNKVFAYELLDEDYEEEEESSQ